MEINNFLEITQKNNDEVLKLYMIFNLSGKKYSIEAEKIVEIIQLPELQVMEKVPEYIVGLINIRGNIIGVIDVKYFLGLSKEKYSLDNQILLININEKMIGFIVDSVDDVVQFDSNRLEILPYENEQTYIDGIFRHNENLIAALNIDKIFKETEHFKLNEVHNADFQPPVVLFPDDELSKEKLKKRALNLQKEIKVDLDRYNAEDNRFVSFSLNNEAYCISLKYVKEFCKLKFFNIIKVPCVPNFIEGLINLRGDFITVIDLKCFLGMDKTQRTSKNKIIVIKSENMKIGFLVDDVYEIMNISAEKIVHNTSKKFETQNFTSADVLLSSGNVMSVLDIEKIIEDEKLFVEDAV